MSSFRSTQPKCVDSSSTYSHFNGNYTSVVWSSIYQPNMTFRWPNGHYYFERIPLSQNIEYRVFDGILTFESILVCTMQEPSNLGKIILALIIWFRMLLTKIIAHYYYYYYYYYYWVWRLKFINFLLCQLPCGLLLPQTVGLWLLAARLILAYNHAIRNQHKVKL
jgi:hypothetical protein